MIQLLYGTGSSLYQADPVHGVHGGMGDHELRAKALATVIPGSHCAPVSLAGIQKPGLDTLTYWGHGDATHFCDLTADDFVKHVSDWRNGTRHSRQ